MKCKMVSLILVFAVSGFSFFGCDQTNDEPEIASGPAVVQEVKVSGKENSYTFSVKLESPDTGCGQYADWWEVILADGSELIYRRILAHSHVSEQPFSRSGGTVNISATTAVIIRGHMFPLGYGEGEIVLKGSVSTGFAPFKIDAFFGVDLEKTTPQPSDCAF